MRLLWTVVLAGLAVLLALLIGGDGDEDFYDGDDY